VCSSDLLTSLAVRRTRPGYATSPSTGESLQVVGYRVIQPKSLFEIEFGANSASGA
jgi:hypothetical protein